LSKGKSEDKAQLEVRLDGANFQCNFVIGQFNDIDSLKNKIEGIISELQSLLESSKSLFEKELEEDIPYDVLWQRFCSMKDEEAIGFYNSLPFERRKEFSDYIFSHCNVFSGKGRLFSERYNPDTSSLGQV
jgi:hypothetical protein